MIPASKQVVDQIILESANVLADEIPSIYASIQENTRLERKDRSSISSNKSNKSASESFDSTCTRTASELENFKTRVITDERLRNIFRLRENFSERFDNRPYLHPHGTTDFNYKAIPEERKEGFERFKNQIRKENYKYFYDHPELRALMYLFTKKLLQTRPSDPVRYLAEYFTSELAEKDIQSLIEAEMRKISNYRISKMLAAGKVRLVKPRPESPKKETPPEPIPPKPKKQCKICPKHCVCIKRGKIVNRKTVEETPKAPGKVSQDNSTAASTVKSPNHFFSSEEEEEEEFEEEFHPKTESTEAEDVLTVFLRTEDGLNDKANQR